MSRVSPRLKRHALIALLCAVPLLLFAVIRETYKWQPRTLPISTFGILGQISWVPDGKTLLVAVDDKLQFWDTTRFQLIRTADVSTDYFTLLRDYKLLYKRKGWTCCFVWDLQKQKDVSNLDMDDLADFVSKDNQIIKNQIINGNLELKFLDLHGHLLKNLIIKPRPGTEFNKNFYNWPFSPDASIGVIQAFNEANGKLAGLMFFNPHDAKPLFFLPQFAFPIGYVPSCFSPDSKTLLICGDGGCQLRDAQTGRLKVSIKDVRIKTDLHLLLPNGNKNWLLGYSDVLNSIFVWDTATGKLLREIKADPNIHDIALSPDGSTLAVKTPNSVKLYRMR